MKEFTSHKKAIIIINEKQKFMSIVLDWNESMKIMITLQFHRESIRTKWSVDLQVENIFQILRRPDFFAEKKFEPIITQICLSRNSNDFQGIIPGAIVIDLV